MNENPAQRALARIEAALSRIEAATSRPPAGAPIDPSLPERHQRLRAEVGQALRELDSLLARPAS